MAVVSVQEVGESRVVVKGGGGTCFGTIVVVVIQKMLEVSMTVDGEGVVGPDPYIASHELGSRLKGDSVASPEVLSTASDMRVFTVSERDE